MKLFSSLYTMVMAWARHRHAPYYLVGVSFAESSFFPVPPDAMLVPMSMAKPRRAWAYAAVATAGSVLGGMVGYAIGTWFFHVVHPYIIQFGYDAAYLQVVAWFKVWGVLAILLAGFSPIPYKLFTIGAGAVGMPFLPFVLASCVGRAGRFFLVSGLISWRGEQLEKLLHRYIDIVGWLFVLLIVVGLLVWKL